MLLTGAGAITSATADAGIVRREIVEAAARHGIDARLVEAVARTESRFDPMAVSPKGAMGIMQLMPGTARALGVQNPWNVRQNVDAGTRHLKDLVQRYNGDLQCALAAYNAGELAVKRNGCAPFDETREYVRLVLGAYYGRAVTLRTRRPARRRRDLSVVAVDEAGRLLLRVRPAGQGDELLR